MTRPKRCPRCGAVVQRYRTFCSPACADVFAKDLAAPPSGRMEEKGAAPDEGRREKGGAVGTNFYIRRVKPTEMHDEYHIAKRSMGWATHFQDSSDNRCQSDSWGDRCPAFHSVADIRALLESGEWQLSDEYGDVWAPGAESLGEFEALCRWNGGARYDGRPCGTYPYDPAPWESSIPGDYRDGEGFVFSPREFR